jgi:hypothetical protein
LGVRSELANIRDRVIAVLYAVDDDAVDIKP